MIFKLNVGIAATLTHQSKSISVSPLLFDCTYESCAQVSHVDQDLAEEVR